ncbi:class I SAM-dependent methyltransferase [Mucilaginibacter sp. UYCu711]|uniref:class I SAM-dependent methyltransferase n=1 Tax=Mucilaginibacter sp. UYCu711 TaxID=3156339 RepID=UPI003D1FC8DA
MGQDSTQKSSKINYGVDAPGVIRNLFIAALAVIVVALFFPVIKIGSVIIETSGFLWSAGGMALGGLLMLVYSLSGKYKHRDRMLNLIDWNGNEQVLDIGTGKGLLMIGAAKKLTTGKSTGIDIWNAADLTGNNVEAALKNAAAEGVADKVEVLNENAMNMSFGNDHFDVILSNMCLHNIYDKQGRKTACAEIKRVLKPGGTAIIADFRNMKEYKQTFDALNLDTKLFPANYLTTFPAVGILFVKKLSL